MNEENKSIEELNTQAAHTRRRVADDVEALSYKVSPENIKEEAKDAVREAGRRATEKVRHTASRSADTGRRIGHDLVTTGRENPIPTAMIGLGIGWLGYMALTHRSRGTYSRPARREGAGMRAISSTKSRASEAAEAAKRRTRELKERSRRRATEAGSQAVHLYEDNPLLVGALTLGAGVAIGMMLPHTRTEDRLLGEYRDDLVDRVKAETQSAAETTKRAASGLVEDVKEDAKSRLGGGAEPLSNGSPGMSTGGNGAGRGPTL